VSCLNSSAVNVSELLQQAVNAAATSEPSATQIPEIQAWRAKMAAALSSPYVDGVLVPLPLTVDASQALNEVVSLMRSAPAAIKIDAPAPASMVDGTPENAGPSKKAAQDCCLQ
jgi:hypothetical protein